MLELAYYIQEGRDYFSLDVTVIFPGEGILPLVDFTGLVYSTGSSHPSNSFTFDGIFIDWFLEKLKVGWPILEEMTPSCPPLKTITNNT